MKFIQQHITLLLVEFKWRGEWRIVGVFHGTQRDMHVFWGKTHARVNAWVAN